MSHNTYKGYVLRESKKPLVYEETSFEGNLPDDHVQVKVSHCGLCYSDVAMVENEWGMTKTPIVLGHEVVGHVSAVGKLVTTLKVGDRVGCSNSARTCNACPFCTSGRDNICAGAVWTVMRGGFGEYVRLHHLHVFKLPDALPNEYAAPLMCAGATVFSPFKVYNILPTHKVGIVGIGGLGHIALMIARAWGCEVTALSTSKDKEVEAKKFGAHHFVCTADKEAVLAAHKHSLDFIMSTATSPIDYSFYMSLLRSGGTFSAPGITGPKIEVNSLDLIIRELKLVGAAGCSRANYREMIDFCALHNIKPQIEVVPASQINEAIEKVKKNLPRYRIVLQH